MRGRVKEGEGCWGKYGETEARIGLDAVRPSSEGSFEGLLGLPVHSPAALSGAPLAVP